MFRNGKGAVVAIIADYDGLVILDGKGARLHPSPTTVVEHGLVLNDRELRSAMAVATRQLDTKTRLAEATALPGYATLAEFAMRSPRKLVHLHLNGKPLPLVLRDHTLHVIEGPDERGSIFFPQGGREKYDSVSHLSKADLKAAIKETARMIVEGDRVAAEGLSNQDSNCLLSVPPGTRCNRRVAGSSCGRDRTFAASLLAVPPRRGKVRFTSRRGSA